ncbi:MAG TPA: hypothetical protein VMU84_13535, partial [Thermoanaerobaculia bacterium]|nr:hypothetical protein [Thermoanaerobaculia bacterium]
GSQPLIMTHGAPTGPNAAEFSVSPASATIQPGQAGSFTVTFDPAAVGPRSATITFSTNDPAQPTISVCLAGTGT